MTQWATIENFFARKVPFKQMNCEGIGQIKVYGLTCAEKDDYEDTVISLKVGDKNVRLKNARAELLRRTIRDGQGRPLFTEAHLGKLMELPAIDADPILDIAKKLSGMKSDEMDDLVKNSQPAEGPSPSDSK